MGTGIGQAARIRTITAKDKAAFIEEIRLARAKYKLSENVEVVCCYEAGLDGFWIHRWLTGMGVTNVVVDSASIEVTRRAKQRKTDRLDVEKLLRQLMRYAAGEQDVWKVVHVPSAEEEDQRHLHRQLLNFKADRVKHQNRIYGLLKTQGVDLVVRAKFLEEMEAVRLWNGNPLPPGLQDRLRREYAQLQTVESRLKPWKKSGKNRSRRATRQLSPRCGSCRHYGVSGTMAHGLLVMEFFGWRKFKNRREVGGLAGLVPHPMPVVTSNTNKASRKPEIAGCGR